VAARAGVSPALASIVLREAAGASAASRQKVLEAAAALRYQPDARARLLRSKRSHLLGVVFGVQHAFHADLVTGLYDAADRLGYHVALSAVTPTRGEERAVAGLLADRCEAVVLLGPQSSVARITELAERMPVVVVARAVRARGVAVVRTDDQQGARDAVDHLVALGHRRIAHVDGGSAPGAAERRRGYLGAMRAHGLDDLATVLPGGLTEPDGVAAAATLLGLPGRPTAVTAFNDRCAVGILQAVRQAGRDVPGEFSMVGLDDTGVAGLPTIELTTVAQDSARIATLAVQRAVDQLEDRAGIGTVVVPPRLVLRRTTAPPAERR
jgi:DNA-binding LacI/PurR family transcriptional regulator